MGGALVGAPAGAIGGAGAVGESGAMGESVAGREVGFRGGAGFDFGGGGGGDGTGRPPGRVAGGVETEPAAAGTMVSKAHKLSGINSETAPIELNRDKWPISGPATRAVTRQVMVNMGIILRPYAGFRGFPAASLWKGRGGEG